MRFWTRSLYGLTLLALTLGLLALAAGSIRQAIAVRDAEEASRPPGSERVFAVGVARLEPVTAKPVLTAYGDLQSSRQLELRAATGGTLLELAPGFRDGGRVTAGETLFRIDPAEADTTLRLAESDLAAATAEEAEARVGLTLAREELAAAARQRDLRAQAQARAEDLQVRGVGSAANIETAELALATSEQVLTGRRLALAEAEARLDHAEIAVTRAGIARD
jgi:multidrug efflux pump subunit AcrA (membrane-fusion protein)